MSWAAPAFLASVDHRASAQPVTAHAGLSRALQQRGVNPAVAAERQLAVAVGDALWAVLFGWRLTPTGIWETRSEGTLVLGRGWLMDPGALRVLAASSPAELWVAEDALDWLALATHWSDASEVERGVVGLVDLRWTAQLARLVPPKSTVVVTSERTGARVLGTLNGRDVAVRLWRPKRTA